MLRLIPSPGSGSTGTSRPIARAIRESTSSRCAGTGEPVRPARTAEPVPGTAPPNRVRPATRSHTMSAAATSGTAPTASTKSGFPRHRRPIAPTARTDQTASRSSTRPTRARNACVPAVQAPTTAHRVQQRHVRLPTAERVVQSRQIRDLRSDDHQAGHRSREQDRRRNRASRLGQRDAGHRRPGNGQGPRDAPGHEWPHQQSEQDEGDSQPGRELDDQDHRPLADQHPVTPLAIGNPTRSHPECPVHDPVRPARYPATDPRGTISVPMTLAHAATTSAPPATAASDRPAAGTTIRAPLHGPQPHRNLRQTGITNRVKARRHAGSQWQAS